MGKNWNTHEKEPSFPKTVFCMLLRLCYYIILVNLLSVDFEEQQLRGPCSENLKVVPDFDLPFYTACLITPLGSGLFLSCRDFFVNFKNFIGSLRLSQATGRGCEDVCTWKDYLSSGPKLGIYLQKHYRSQCSVLQTILSNLFFVST